MSAGLRAWLNRIRSEANAYRLMAVNPRTPWVAKAVLLAAVAYLVSPVDLIPDVVPVIGHLDDVIVVGLLVGLGVALTPRSVRNECRRAAGISPGCSAADE